jgi:hypothetical protein
MSNPNYCEHCGHKQNPDGGWCYMFRMEPTGPCAKHTIGVAAAMAHRLQVARRTLDSMKPNTEGKRPAQGTDAGPA